MAFHQVSIVTGKVNRHERVLIIDLKEWFGGELVMSICGQKACCTDTQVMLFTGLRIGEC